MPDGLKLPTYAMSFDEQRSHGFGTPVEDRNHQVSHMLPRRVIPIVFLPGIMGSNLRISSAQRQKELGKSNNRAWRPDDKGSAVWSLKDSAAERQLRLDPTTTAVDVYDRNGPADVSGDDRHDNIKSSLPYVSPMVADDPAGVADARTASQKARSRGWSEVFFSSYGRMLQHLEARMNNFAFDAQGVGPWNDVVGIDPKVWGADACAPLKALTRSEFHKATDNRWFPVWAFGYNWLQPNGDSAVAIARRINDLIDAYRKAKFDCDKVIVVTHSMGGIVGRALVHPEFGNMKDKVLGIVHGAQPALGAAAAYRRMRAGFEDPGLVSARPMESMSAKVLGNYGTEVTAVLANSQGGLELLPSEEYGNGWLKVTHQGKLLDAWPKGGDPYEEIYKLRGTWYGLLKEAWINPSGYDEDKGGGSFGKTLRHLDKAKAFHRKLSGQYHDVTYAHYGVDAGHMSLGDVVWNIDKEIDASGRWRDWQIDRDSRQGRVDFKGIGAAIAGANEPGDGTVPMRSSDDQMRSGRFQGIFRQVGYEHQASYADPNVLAATLYCLVRIAQHAK